MAGVQTSEWQQAYREALAESNPRKLEKKIAKAEALICFRLGNSAQGIESAVERRAVNDALRHLHLFADERPEPAETEWE